MSEELAEYIAITIAESRVRKAREKLRDKLLQQCQLEDDGRLVDMADGVSAAYIECPACMISVVDYAGHIEVSAPFGLEAGEMAQPPLVHLTKITDDVILWGVAHGVFKLSVDTKMFDSYAQQQGPEAAYMMGQIGGALTARTAPTLRVISPEKLKEEA